MPEKNRRFPTTHLTLLQRLNSSDPEQAATAIKEVCERYYYPLFYHARRRGLTEADASDLVQTFFEKFLRNDSFKKHDPTKGKLREFFIVSLNNLCFTWQQREKKHKSHVPLDEHEGIAGCEKRYSKDSFAKDKSQEEAFDLIFYRELMLVVMNRVEKDYKANGHELRFNVLKRLFDGQGDELSVRAAAEKMKVTPEYTRVLLHRLRFDFGSRLLDEIRQITSNEAEAQEELAYIRRLFRLENFFPSDSN